MRERGRYSTTTPAQPRRPCRPRHPYAVPRTSLQCVCTRRRNCIEQLSPSPKYAPRLTRFPVTNSATNQTTRWEGRSPGRYRFRPSSLTVWAYAREAGSHTLAPGVPITTRRTGMSPGRALVPYGRAGTPAVHDTGTAGGSVTAGPAATCVSGNRNGGEKSCDQKGSHISLHQRPSNVCQKLEVPPSAPYSRLSPHGVE